MCKVLLIDMNQQRIAFVTFKHLEATQLDVSPCHPVVGGNSVNIEVTIDQLLFIPVNAALMTCNHYVTKMYISHEIITNVFNTHCWERENNTSVYTSKMMFS